MSVSGADEPVTGWWAPLWGQGREVPSAGSCGHAASSGQLPDVLWLWPRRVLLTHTHLRTSSPGRALGSN